MPPTFRPLLRCIGTGRAARAWVAVLALTALGACASPQAASPVHGSDGCRLLAQPSDAQADAQTLAVQATQAAGIAVRAEPTAPSGWWLLHLAASDAADCERASRQLAAAQPPLFTELHADARRRSPPRPHGPSTR